MTSSYCVNCFISLGPLGAKHYVKEIKEIDLLIRSWSTLLCDIPTDALLCKRCWIIAKDGINTQDPIPKRGHPDVCILCGRSVMRIQRKSLKNVQETLFNEIQKRAYPRPVNRDSHCCHACNLRVTRALNRTAKQIAATCESEVETEANKQPSDDEPEPDLFIKLSDYIRAPEISNKCFVETCDNTNVEIAPFFMRTSLLKQCNFYIPKTSLVCANHKTNWDFMAQPMEEIHFFKPQHVAGMLQLMSGK